MRKRSISETKMILKPLQLALRKPEKNPDDVVLPRRRHFIALRNVNFARGAGRLDLLIVSDEPSLILVEAKKSNSPLFKHASAGQLLLYYAHALKTSVKELQSELVRVATKKWQKGVGLDKICQKAGVTREQVFEWLKDAKHQVHRKPRTIRAFVAVNSWNEKQDGMRLGRIIRLLRKHKLPFGVVVCSPRRSRLKVPKGLGIK